MIDNGSVGSIWQIFNNQFPTPPLIDALMVLNGFFGTSSCSRKRLTFFVFKICCRYRQCTNLLRKAVYHKKNNAEYGKD